jgi:hypothetical protein
MKYFSICIILLFFYSCSNSVKSPKDLAKVFCNCSEKLGNAITDNKTKKLSDKDFEKVRMEWIQCMGPNDPRSAMNPEEVEKFDEDYKKEILKQCPNIAQHYGFN